MKKVQSKRLATQVERLERDLLKSKKQLARLRQSIPPREVGEYAFTTFSGGKVKLSKLFGSSSELTVVHNMGKSCPYCTMWADGFNGVYQHLENRAPFVVISPDEHRIQKKFAQGRGWKFKMVSAHGTSFFKDMGFENKSGHPQPGVSTFRRDGDGRMYQVSKTSFGPGDDFCSVWHFLDLLPNGKAGWEPKYKYR
ncbi:MAG TPA: DUF899 family protein [Candidatus Acidoferrum sp.]|nr:DUF899 family protein [Candidatus Acidoferrum sp.]